MRYLLLCLCLMSAACSTMNPSQSPLISVSIDEPQRIRFSGKGAGAGVMLSSSMGPMGIAIGVAIDEGIAKDIHSSFTAAGYELVPLISSSFDLAMSNAPIDGMITEDLSVNIERISYKTVAGDGDPVVPNVKGSIEYLGKAILFSELECSELVLVPVQLADIKASGDVTYQSLSRYFLDVFTCWRQSS